MATEEGQLTWAAHLWGAADAVRETIRVSIPLIERLDNEHSIVTARTRLGEKDFAAAWEAGRAMTPEQAITSRRAMQSMRPRLLLPPLHRQRTQLHQRILPD